MSEPTRLPVFLRARRSGRRVCAIVIALCAIAGSAFAKIGESYAQVLQEARQDKDAVAITPWNYDGKPALRVQYRNTDVIHHMFSTQGREIGFYWYANHEVTWKEVAVIQRVFKTKWHRTQLNPHWTTWESHDGMVLGVQSKALHILQLNAIEQLPAVATNEAGLHRVPTTHEDSAIDRFLDSPLPAATQASPVASKPTPTDQNDCLPFALEALARLKKSSHWAEIAGFTWIEDGKKIGGHAVVFYQPTEKSNIWMYDRSGSLDLQTRSHDPNEIVAALNQRIRSNLRVESPRWLENDDSRTEFASNTSNQQPAWKKTGPMTPYQVGQLMGRLIVLIMLLAGYAYIVVVCFLKGKSGFAVLGIFGFFIPVLGWAAIIGAIRIAKPHSRWARKRYGSEKMAVALQRFIPGVA